MLAIRAVDVCKKENVQDANVTLRLTFPSEVRPACVAFAEPEGHDVLLVYVLTKGGQLFVLSLRPEYFRRVASTEDNLAEWCRVHTSNGLTFNKVHRLVALRADELLAALSDGGLLRLEKASGDNSWLPSTRGLYGVLMEIQIGERDSIMSAISCHLFHFEILIPTEWIISTLIELAQYP